MKNLNSTLSANSAANAEDVMATKIFLRNQGHYTPPEWGISQFPDRALFEAIAAFQKSQGLKVDGVMKPEGETETAIKAHALARFLDTKSIQGVAQKLQSKGRNGDTILAHISPAEAQLLHDVTDGGSINPETGLPEFFFGDFFGGLSDSFSSIGTSLSDSFSSFGDSFSNSLSDFGDNFSSGLNDTFGDGFSDKLGGVMGNVTSQVAGDYVSKKVGGPFGDMLGGAVGSTLGNTVSGAFSSAESATQPKAADLGTFGTLNNDMNTQKASLPKSTPKIDLNLKAGQTHVGAAQQNRNVKILNKQRDVAAQQSTIQKKAPLTLNQKIEATAKKMNATRIAEQKAKMPASQQAIYNDLVAKAKAGRQKMLAQQGTPQATKLLGTTSPTRSAEVPASQARTATPAYKISDEDEAAIGREADSIVKTKNLEGPLKYHKDAYATGTPKAKAEFENFLGKVHDKDPGKAQDIIANMRKSGFDVGVKTQTTANEEESNWGNVKDVAGAAWTNMTGSPEEVKKELHGLADKYEENGYKKSPKMLRHFLDGEGKDMEISREEARNDPFIVESEEKNRSRFENRTFLGKTKRNHELNKKLKGLKDGETLSFIDHWDHTNKEEQGYGTLLSNDRTERDAFLAEGMRDAISNFEGTATRKGNKIHFKGDVTFDGNETYDFEKGGLGQIMGARQLTEKNLAHNFEVKRTWVQDVIGTVDVGPDGKLSNPKFEWKDKN